MIWISSTIQTDGFKIKKARQGPLKAPSFPCRAVVPRLVAEAEEIDVRVLARGVLPPLCRKSRSRSARVKRICASSLKFVTLRGFPRFGDCCNCHNCCNRCDGQVRSALAEIRQQENSGITDRSLLTGYFRDCSIWSREETAASRRSSLVLLSSISDCSSVSEGWAG